MNLLITGATGFVGKHLRSYVLQHTDWSITGTSYPAPPPEPTDPERETLVYLDMRERDMMRSVLQNSQPDYVVHLAAQAHVPTAFADPWATLENNILGQLNLLECAHQLSIKPRILVIGSSEEYGRGDPDAMPLRETDALQPENPYSVSKVAQDVLGYQYFRSHDIPVIRVRPFNHVGPGQSPRFVLAAFAKQVAEIETGQTGPVLRVGNLSAARDFTDVRDVVRAYVLLLQIGIPGEVYNVASGQPRSIQSLVDRLIALSTQSITVEIDPERFRPTDAPLVYGSAEKLHSHTGWKPEITFEQTLRDVLEEWRQIVK